MPSVAIANAWYHHSANGGKKTLPSRQQVSSFVKMCLEDIGGWRMVRTLGSFAGDWWLGTKEAVWSMNDQAAVVVVAAGHSWKPTSSHLCTQTYKHHQVEMIPRWSWSCAGKGDAGIFASITGAKWCGEPPKNGLGGFSKRQVEHADLSSKTERWNMTWNSKHKSSRQNMTNPLEGVQLFVFQGKGINR